MKAPPFEYRAPRDLDEALEELSRHGDEAKILAGGQSLVPAMNLRLAAPRVIVDINRIGDLDGVEVGSQEIRVGALVRHARFDRERGRDGLWRLLSSISHHVGHLPIRLRGTFCGSLAHADPAAEWCTAALALDARVIASGARGSRTIDARDFFDSAFTTALAPDEILTEVRLPLLGDAAGVGFAEVSRTAGDFALVASLAVLRVEGGRIAEARIGLAGVEARPVRAGRAEDALVG
ncbi:MAG: FAD binding domain-containing protein, partial [Actinomycetota bacterium]